MGTAEDGYIGGLNLSVTGSTGKHYYLRVVAINGAGLTSLPMTGTKITILNGDITGMYNFFKSAKFRSFHSCNISGYTMLFVW